MNDFGRLLEAQIPRLRRYARALTRDLARADDLVQNCLTRAVAKQHLWQYGTDLRAWLFTILHNQHVNDIRRSVREGASVAVEEMEPVLTVQSNAIASLQLRDLEIAIGKLPQEQREVILLVGLEGMSYAEVAAILGVPVGTVRSRLSRGRDQLRRLMDMEKEPPSERRPRSACAAEHSASGKGAPPRRLIVFKAHKPHPSPSGHLRLPRHQPNPNRHSGAMSTPATSGTRRALSRRLPLKLNRW
jgi:RNA polymerase sigma-70 factor, ECF subfamily